ncbi:9978_t:CDS:2, partial [Paraglomus occultum]
MNAHTRISQLVLLASKSNVTCSSRIIRSSLPALSLKLFHRQSSTITPAFLDTIQPFLQERSKPPTSSYFTGKPAYYDLLIQLDDLISKYSAFPKREKPPLATLWKLNAVLSQELGVSLKTSQYSKIVQKLNELDLVEASEVKEFLKLFKRHYQLVDKREELASSKHGQLDEYKRSLTVGRRKEATARVFLIKGTGDVRVNGRPLADYFIKAKDRETCIFPFVVTGTVGQYNVWALVKGGGPTGQSGAIAHAITKGLLIYNYDFKPILRK